MTFTHLCHNEDDIGLVDVCVGGGGGGGGHRVKTAKTSF